MEKEAEINLSKMTDEDKELTKDTYIGQVKDSLDGMNLVDNALCFIENGSDLEDRDAGGVYIKAFATSNWMAYMIYKFIQEHPSVGRKLGLMMLKEQVADALSNGDFDEAKKLAERGISLMGKSPDVEAN